MLRHLVTHRQLDAFADAELDRRNEHQVLRHLDECVDCVTELELIVWTKTQLALHSRAQNRDVATDCAGAVRRLERWARLEVLGGR